MFCEIKEMKPVFC